MGIVTDSTPVDQPKNPDTCNVFNLYKLFAAGDEPERSPTCTATRLRDAEARGGRPFGFGDREERCCSARSTPTSPVRERRKQLARDPGTVEEALQLGARRAREVPG